MLENNEFVYRIRFIKDEDFESLIQIINDAYRKPGGWTTEAHIVRGERITLEDLKKIRDPILVAEGVKNNEQNVIIGCISAEYSNIHSNLDLPNNSALLGLFAVDPAYQSKGVGKKLLNACIEMLKNDGITTAVIWVIHHREEIINWYEKQGFKWTGQIRDFVFPDLLITSDSHFKIFSKNI